MISDDIRWIHQKKETNMNPLYLGVALVIGLIIVGLIAHKRGEKAYQPYSPMIEYQWYHKYPFALRILFGALLVALIILVLVVLSSLPG